MSYTQVKLTTDNGEQMTTWVDSDPKLKRGVVIELKNDARMWLVDDVYSTIDDLPDHRNFDNNDYSKHEGLFKK